LRAPALRAVCPVGATWKRHEDGIVVVDYNTCIGCRYCMTACPYGARYFDFGDDYNTPQNDFEQQPSAEYGKAWPRDGGSPIGNVRKCHFCLHRVVRGEEPACVVTCMARARIFGDLNDPESEIARLVAERRHFRLKEELGTEPNVYYLL
jgi:Fe-S-cluster-containing dehydrogenase component